ncbi:MAG: hypothetical protein HOC71_09030 [Candidatus Latescibacteria bacterium]|jgi:predicted transcriptional regulator|nr:hypothetical protein [Candidatus Latescibacterota bacterium]
MKHGYAELSKLEWQIMRVCWENEKVSTRNVLEEIKKERKTNYMVIKTTLDRLVEKEFVDKEKFGPIWLYFPKEPQDATTSTAITEFIKTVLGDKIAPILLHIVNKKEYYKELRELDVLKDLVDNIKDGD